MDQGSPILYMCNDLCLNEVNTKLKKGLIIRSLNVNGSTLRHHHELNFFQSHHTRKDMIHKHGLYCIGCGFISISLGSHFPWSLVVQLRELIRHRVTLHPVEIFRRLGIAADAPRLKGDPK